MLARFQGQHRLIEMILVGGGDDNRIDVRAPRQRLSRLLAVDAIPLRQPGARLPPQTATSVAVESKCRTASA